MLAYKNWLYALLKYSVGCGSRIYHLWSESLGPAALADLPVYQSRHPKYSVCWGLYLFCNLHNSSIGDLTGAASAEAV